MQYESNPANSFRDIVRKPTTDAEDARPDMVVTIHPAPTSWAGDKRQLLSFYYSFYQISDHTYSVKLQDCRKNEM